MAALTGEPWRGNCVVRVHSGGSAARHFRLSTFTSAGLASDTVADGDREWQAAPGAEVEVPPTAIGGKVTLTWDTTSPLTAPPQATIARIRAYLPGTSTQVGTTRTITISGDSGSVTVNCFMDANPFDGDGVDGNRAGTIEWYLEVERNSGVDQWGPANSRGGFTNPGLRQHDWARGYARARSTLLSHTVSNVAIDGAEPATFAYPDPIYVRATLDAQFFGSDTVTLNMEQAEATIRAESEFGVGPVFDFEEDSISERVDSDFAAAAVDLELLLDVDGFGGDDEYAWAPGGHEAGWTRVSDRELQRDARFDVDPTLTIVAEALDLAAATVFNRGEAQGGTFEVRNARGETFTPLGTETVTVERVADGTDEDAATVSRAAGVTSWDVTFGAAGNVAPADVTGDQKRLVWDDVASGVNTGLPTSSPIGFLSSLLDVTSHLQLNDNVLDPALDGDNRLTSDLGFYSLRITNRRGQGKDGVTVTDHLQDDQSLVAAEDRTDVTATINGHAGYLPLKAWAAALPGGGWDHWTDGGTFEGNTFEQARKGPASADFTLLALDPNLIVVASGGHDEPGESGLHWTSSNELLVGCTLFNTATNDTVPADDDTVLDPGGQPRPRAFMIVARFNVATGTAQFYDSDGVWRDVEAAAGTVHQWPLLSIRRSNELTGVGSVGDERTYVHKFSAAETADWGNSTLFFVPIVFRNSTPYSIWGMTGVTGASNQHNGYAVDPVALGLHGVLGTR